MTTQALNVTILSAPVAAADRRALSQAWYSALHLAREEAAAHGDLSRRAGPYSPETSGLPAQYARGAAHTALDSARETTAKAMAGAKVAAVEERRATVSPLARKIERALLHPRRTARRSSLTIDGSKARVAVTVQETTRGVRLVAMCAPRSRAVVARALEEARYALAARGILLLHTVAGGPDDR